VFEIYKNEGVAGFKALHDLIGPENSQIRKESGVTVASAPAVAGILAALPSCAIDPHHSPSSSLGLSEVQLKQLPPSYQSRYSATRFSPVDWTNDERPDSGVSRSLIDKDTTATYRVSITATARPNSSRTPSKTKICTVVNKDGRASYYKVACLMFAALFVVWVPSTINRLQQLFDKGNPIFGLNLASALVLPTQGLWNCMIYVLTSWTQLKQSFRESRLFKWFVPNVQPPDSRRGSERSTIAKTSRRDLELGLDGDNDDLIGLTDILRIGPPASVAGCEEKSARSYRTDRS
jgi:hypothetical protein